MHPVDPERTPGASKPYPQSPDAYPPPPVYPTGYPGPPGGAPAYPPYQTPGPAPGPPGVYPPPYPGYPVGYPGGYPSGSWGSVPPSAPNRGKAVAAAALAGALVLAGVGFVAYRHLQSRDSAYCSVAGARVATMNKKLDGEPSVSIPLTDGWEQITPEDFQKAESAGLARDVRAGFFNDGIRENDVTPDIVVTVKTTSDLSNTPDEIHELSIRDIAKKATITNQSQSTVCGNTMYRIDSIRRGSPGEHPMHHMYLSVITQQNDTRWGVNLAIKTTNPDNPKYLAERDALLKGFRVELPKS